MKTKLLILAAVATLLAAVPTPGRSQDLVGESMYQLAALWSDATSGLLTPPVGPCYAEDLSCGDGSCGQCNACCRQTDIFGSVEYLMWWAKGTPLPPLVTTSPDPSTLPIDAGVLGLDSTDILFGNQMGGKEIQAGGRVTLGIWLDRDHEVAAGGRFFALGGDTTQFTAASDGSEILARPFFNAFLGVEDALLISYPNFAAGSISATSETKNIFGVDAFMEVMMHRECRHRIDLVAGYSFMRLDDSLDINSNHTIIQPGPGLGTEFDISDRFRAYNTFHGGQTGLRGRISRGCWSVDALAVVAAGGVRQQVVIQGEQIITQGGVSTPNPVGLLAQTSNIGNYERTKFTFIPSLTVNLKYHVNPCLNFHVGYNLIWINDVALSGDQVDLRVNLNQPLPPPLPAFAFRDRDYWLQGLNFGASWDF